ncbi:acid protease [Panus rudis PR-1116 ss-1]|nr:acid protease [Panus rudis PR-1116 ss-1]
MFQGIPLLATLALALAVAANPIVIRDSPVTLPIAKRFNFSGDKTLLERDQARAKGLRRSAEARFKGTFHEDPTSVDVINDGVTYVAVVGVGSPATLYNLLIDTGSSNTWAGANASHPYKTSSTTKPTGDSVEVIYGSGVFSGIENNDTVSLGNGLTVSNQSIGAADPPPLTSGFNGVDGILGLGPVGLTQGTLAPHVNKLIPTVTDNLYYQGIIPQNVVAIFFQPTNSLSNPNGELTFGGTDPSKYTNDITYTPVTNVSPASAYWGIDQHIGYGGDTILNKTAGIVDTGTTLILIATDAYNTYKNMTGGQPDSATGLLKITPPQYAALKSLQFNVGGTTFELTPNAQIFPRSLNTAIGGKASDIYLIVADIGSPSGSGLDFINGYTFLERFYSVFDTTNRRVGLATTSFTNATTN